MPSPSAEERLLRGLADLELAAGLADPVAPSGGPRSAPTCPSPEPPARSAVPRIRSRGPALALVLPALLGLVALALLAGDNSTRQGVLGFAAAVLAAPLLPVVGVPLRTGLPALAGAVVGSLVLWLALGSWAARRATRGPAPTWLRFAANYLWMVLAVWLGLAVAALASDLVLGRPLL